MRLIIAASLFFILHIIAPIALCTSPAAQLLATSNISNEKEIVFGQSIQLTGQFKLYGNIIKNSINACFQRINHEENGVSGKTLRLLSIDDKGNPETALHNVEIMQQNGIKMFLGNMGTRCISQILPKIAAKEIALFFPWAGGEKFTNPKLSHLVNGPGLLKPQIQKIVSHIAHEIGHKKIAIFHADDDFSIQAVENLKEELINETITPTIISGYNRFSLNLIPQIDKILGADPKIVICVSTNMPTTQLISRFFEKGHYATMFYGIDSTLFVSDILKDRGIRFSYTSAVPDPLLSSSSIAAQYRKDLANYAPSETANILSFSYYLSALIIVEAIKQITGKISPEQIIANIEKMKNYDLGGFTVNFDETNRHAFGSNISLIKG